MIYKSVNLSHVITTFLLDFLVIKFDWMGNPYAKHDIIRSAAFRCVHKVKIGVQLNCFIARPIQ